ncbi:MAG: BtrH N-terminal domain-containing protein [Anaerolineae bacterium]
MRITNFPHQAGRVCYVVSLRDVLAYQGHDMSEAMVAGVGSNWGMAYLKFGGQPMVLFGSRPFDFYKRVAERLEIEHYDKKKSASFQAAWRYLRKLLDAGTPVVIGPLDMFHLTYIPFPEHNLWHFVVAASYDDSYLYVYDNRTENEEALPLADLDKAWSVRSLSRGPYALNTFTPPAELPLAPAIREAILFTADSYLQPPISMFGYKATRKVAKEIAKWPQMVSPDELGGIMGMFILQCETRGAQQYPAFLVKAAEVLGLGDELEGPIADLRRADEMWATIGEGLKQILAYVGVSASETEMWITIGERVKAAQEAGALAPILADAGRTIGEIVELEEVAYAKLREIVGVKLQI